MTNIFPSHFHINIPFLVLFILAIIAGVATYYYYRKTIPPVSDKIRILLGLLRGSALFFILSLFFSPQLKLVWQNEEKPEIVFIIDRSASMGIADSNQKRFTEAKSIANDIQEQIQSTNLVSTYYFDTDTISDYDSVNVRNLATNIDQTLKKISSKHKTAETIILVSDGIITDGSNPLFSNTLKKHIIHTIGIGDTSETPDILIKNVIANKTVYKNNPTTISAEITTKNLDTFSSTVKLISKNQIIAAKKINITKSDQIYPVKFEITPGNDGLVTYQVQVEGFINEKFTKNNIFSVQLEVLKDKLHVGLLVNQPGYDLKFIKQMIQMDSNLKLSSFTGIYRNVRVQQMTSIIDSSDVLIIIDIPGKNTPQSLSKNLRNLIENRRIPVCFFIQDNPTKDYLTLLKNRFPDFTFNRLSSPINIFTEPTITGKLNPVFNIFDNSESNNEFWQTTAPIEYIFKDIRIGETDKILLQAKDNPNQPVLISNSQKGLNNLVFFGIGFWRWNFLLAEDRQFAGAYETFFNNLIKWIAKNPGTDNVNIEVSKKGLPLGEELITNIQVYDAAFSIVEDGEIKLTINGPDGDFEATAKNTGKGNYQWQFIPMAEGSYTIKADAYKNDVFLGSNQTEINVLPVSKEFLITKQDAEFLKKLAAFTGGNYFTPSNYNEIIPILPKIPNIVESTRNYDIWNKLYTLLLIIFLLSAEWFIRKRKGLA